MQFAILTKQHHFDCHADVSFELFSNQIEFDNFWQGLHEFVFEIVLLFYLGLALVLLLFDAFFLILDFLFELECLELFEVLAFLLNPPGL